MSGANSTEPIWMPPKLEQGVATERVQIVAPTSWVNRIEEWRRGQPRIPTRSEAIRMLVDEALASQGKSKPRASK